MNRLLVVAGASASPAPNTIFAQSLASAFERRSWQVAVCDVARDADRGLSRALSAARRISSHARDGRRPVLVLIGSEPLLLRLTFAFASAGLLPAIKLVVRVRCASVPLDPSLAHLFRLADLVVADSALGARAVSRCCAEAGSALDREPVVVPASLGVESSLLDVAEEERAAWRERIFGVANGALLIGCGAGTPLDPRSFLAMRIFRIFADGLYWSCARCDGITIFDDEDDERPRPVSTCARCGGADGSRGARWPTARLFLADRHATGPGGAWQLGRWTLDGLRRRWRLEGRVMVEGDDGLPPADSMETMVRRLACLDMHLLPHHLSDLEPVLLASCALAVPVITTRFGVAAEMLGGAARLVAPCITLDDSAGHRTAIMDAAGAVRELLFLARHEAARASLGAAGRAAVRAHADDGVLSRWVSHLDRLVEA